MNILVLLTFLLSCGVEKEKAENGIEYRVSDSNIIELPDHVYEDSLIQFLSVKNSHLESVSSKIVKLKHLEVVYLTGNKLSDRSVMYLWQIPNLRQLYLSRNGIDTLLGEEIICDKLEVLDLIDNNLSELPKLNLPQLLVLNLRGNRFENFPKYICDLRKLESLTIGFNPLRSIPECISSLENLKDVSFNNDSLSFLPKEIGSLKNLESLNLRNNQLTSLPKELENATKLKELDVAYNNMTEIPPCLYTIPNVERIVLKGNPIEKEQLTEFQNLRKGVEIIFYP